MDYYSALEVLNLDTLSYRRHILSLNFAKKCMKHEQTRDMFPLNTNNMVDVRQREKYHVQYAKGSRLLNSSIPQLQRALNDDAMK